jgi:hypothetical protein
LDTYRQSLAVYIRQLAILGEAYIPPGVMHGIRECRENIRRIKSTLIVWGANFENLPDDEPPDA